MKTPNGFTLAMTAAVAALARGSWGNGPRRYYTK